MKVNPIRGDLYSKANVSQGRGVKEGSELKTTETPENKTPQHVDVLIVHSSHTGGHASAAKALEKAFREMGINAKQVNTLSYTDKSVAETQVKLSNFIFKWGKPIRAFFFRKSVEGSKLVKFLGNLALRFKAMHSKKFINYLKEVKPKVIISTHSQTNAILSYLKERGEVNVPVLSVLTDYKTHIMWAQENISQYYVATENVRDQLVKFGVPKWKVKVTGIPIDPVFAKHSKLEAKKAEFRKDLGLDPNVPTLMITAGSLGLTDFEHWVKLLDNLPENFQIIVITGRNKVAKEKLENLKTKKKLLVKGFVSDMYKYMAASDFVITKPGGLTTTELLAMKRPMIIITPQPGIEETMAEELARIGVALVPKSDQEFIESVKEMLDPERRKRLEEKVSNLSKPDSAYRIAEDVKSRFLR